MKKIVNPLTLLLIVSLWLASVCNIALWRELKRLNQLNNAADYAFAAAFGLIIFAATVFCTAWLAWRKTIKPLLTFLLLVAAVAAYYMMTYSVVIDSTMLTNVVQTDVREARDVLSWQLLAYVLMLCVLPAVWLWRRPVAAAGKWWQQLLKNALAMLAAAALLVGTLFAVYQPFASLMRNHTHVRYLINPLSSLWSAGVIAAQPFKKPRILQPLGRDAAVVTRAGQPPKILLLIIGETARAANFQLNGYARATNPLLAQRNDVVSFTQATSCGTSTAASLPCMFAHVGREAYSSNSYQENLLDVLQHAGLGVIWVDNQSGCKGLCDRVPGISTTNLKEPAFCTGGECFDAIMLSKLDAEIAKLPAEKRAKGIVIVLHQMGSHGPAYFKRSPPAFKKFQPECASNILQNCPQQNIINAYDNTILYADYLINEGIKWLEGQEKSARTAMLYVSDHGESLGENNLYLHGLPYAVAPDFQKHVPWISWASVSFGLPHDCLVVARDKPISHDNLFHTVLGMMDVQTGVYRVDWDAYANCRVSNTH